MKIPQTLKTEMQYDPTVPLLGIYLKQLKPEEYTDTTARNT